MKETSETIEGLYDKAEEKTGETLRSASERAREGMRRAGDVIDDIADYVSRNPVSSVLWGAAAGLAVGVGISKLRSSQNSHPFLERVKEGVEAGEKSWRQIRTGWKDVLAGLKSVASDCH